MMSLFRRIRAVGFISIFVLSAAIFAGGSSEGSQQENSSAADASASGEYPIVIEHVFGTTVIEQKPERIATVAWGNQDVPLALGVIPVGVSMANYGVVDDSGLLPWTKDAFSELGVSEPVLFNDLTELDYEGISEAQPDVILAAYSGLTQREYDILSEIAPVVAYPTNPWQTSWRDMIALDSMGMGMYEQGQDLVAEIEDLIVQKVGEYPVLQGKNAALFWFNPADLGNFYLYLPGDPRADYLIDLGFETPASVQDIASKETSFAVALSAENADIFSDIDVIVMYGDQEILAAMQADPLLGLIPAVAKGAVVAIPDATPLAASVNPSPLSIPATIDEYLALLADAAGRAE